MVMKQQGMQFDRMDFSSLLWHIPLLQHPKGRKERRKEETKREIKEGGNIIVLKPWWKLGRW